MTDELERWISRLPWRWALGGFCIGMFWVTRSVPHWWRRADESGVVPMDLLALTLQIALLPTVALGFAWGWSERRGLRAAATHDGGFARAVRHFGRRQVGKGALCGMALGVYIAISELVRLSFTAPALIRTENFLVSFVTAKILGLIVSVLFGSIIGLIVGFVAKRSIRQRWRGETDAARVF